ncbi:MAG: hypothetical protein KGJ07_10350 [Patescibacteria group bacterium]|nr:hypothetical protein [Patescibacteria group bacterium]
MAQDVESIYNEYLSKLKQAMPNVDPNLVHRVIFLERKISEEGVSEPDVSAIIEYKPGVDVDSKVSGLRQKYSLEVEHGDSKNVIHAMGRMKVGKIQEISKDRDIVRISGKADPGLGE